MVKSVAAAVEVAVEGEDAFVHVFGDVGEQDEAQVGQIVAQAGDFFGVLLLGGDEQSGFAFVQPLEDGFWAEGGEEGHEDAARFEGAQGGDVEFGDAAGEDGDAVAAL
jgi:hypothetical protein